jgi:hypothetical protein
MGLTGKVREQRIAEVRETKRIKYPRKYGILQTEQFGGKAWN